MIMIQYIYVCIYAVVSGSHFTGTCSLLNYKDIPLNYGQTKIGEKLFIILKSTDSRAYSCLVIITCTTYASSTNCFVSFCKPQSQIVASQKIPRHSFLTCIVNRNLVNFVFCARNKLHYFVTLTNKIKTDKTLMQSKETLAND